MEYLTISGTEILFKFLEHLESQLPGNILNFLIFFITDNNTYLLIDYKWIYSARGHIQEG